MFLKFKTTLNYKQNIIAGVQNGYDFMVGNDSRMLIVIIINFIDYN